VPHSYLGDQRGPALCPKRARVVVLYTDPPPSATSLCVDERGPVTLRAFPPAPGWSPDGHRITVAAGGQPQPGDSLGVWGVRVRDGQELTLTALSRNTASYLRLLEAINRANP